MKRILPIVSSIALVAFMLTTTAGVTNAWTPPGITPLCSDVEGQYNWTITLGKEDNYNFQYGPDGVNWPVTVGGEQGSNPVTTNFSTLYVRWASDHNS